MFLLPGYKLLVFSSAAHKLLPSSSSDCGPERSDSGSGADDIWSSPPLDVDGATNSTHSHVSSTPLLSSSRDSHDEVGEHQQSQQGEGGSQSTNTLPIFVNISDRATAMYPNEKCMWSRPHHSTAAAVSSSSFVHLQPHFSKPSANYHKN